MKKLQMSLFICFGVLFLVGCGSGTEQSLPTFIPTLVNTEPATATVDVPAASTPTPIGGDRATLPPTWTVSPIPSETVPPTLDETAQALAVKPTLVVCGAFGVDRERNPDTYVAGQPVTVYWFPVDTAARYRIRLISETGAELFSDIILDSTYTFEAKLFDGRLRYAWQVYPEDSLNQQMCFDRGDDLLPAP